MRDPLRVQVTGPLEPFAPGFVAELGRLGYACPSVVHQVQLVAHLSRWMTAEGFAAGELSDEMVERFVVSRRAAGYRHFLMPSALAPLLGYLRALGVMAVPTVAASVGPAWCAGRALSQLSAARARAGHDDGALLRVSRASSSARCPRGGTSWIWRG